MPARDVAGCKEASLPRRQGEPPDASMAPWFVNRGGLARAVGWWLDADNQGLWLQEQAIMDADHGSPSAGLTALGAGD